MQFRNYRLNLWAVGVAAALAGCGGGGNSGPATVATTPAPPNLPAPPPQIPSDPAATGFDGTYAGFFAGVDQAGNVITTTATSSALSGVFTTDLAATNASPTGRVTATGNLADDGTITANAQGNSALPGSITVTGQVQPLGTGLYLTASVVGQNTQNSQNAAANLFQGRIVGIQDGTDNNYAGGYTGTLSGTGGNGNFNFTVASDGSVRGEVTSLDTFSTTFNGFGTNPNNSAQNKAALLIGAVTRDGLVRLTGVSGQPGQNGDPAAALFIDFQGQGDLSATPATITGFFTVGPAQNAQTGTFTARRLN